jgi:hypothetical protein
MPGDSTRADVVGHIPLLPAPLGVILRCRPLRLRNFVSRRPVGSQHSLRECLLPGRFDRRWRDQEEPQGRSYQFDRGPANGRNRRNPAVDHGVGEGPPSTRLGSFASAALNARFAPDCSRSPLRSTQPGCRLLTLVNAGMRMADEIDRTLAGPSGAGASSIGLRKRRRNPAAAISIRIGRRSLPILRR